jgi:hypothetical protein
VTLLTIQDASGSKSDLEISYISNPEMFILVNVRIVLLGTLRVTVLIFLRSSPTRYTRPYPYLTLDYKCFLSHL